MRLLVVCLGNICRSPMAEGALVARLREAGLAQVVAVDSCGTGNWHAGEPPDARAIACAARNGVDIGGLRARQLATADFDTSDVVLCADRSTLETTRARAPAGKRERCLLFSRYAGHGDIEIPDPYTGTARDFGRVWTLVDGMARDIARTLQAAGR